MYSRRGCVLAKACEANILQEMHNLCTYILFSLTGPGNNSEMF